MIAQLAHTVIALVALTVPTDSDSQTAPTTVGTTPGDSSKPPVATDTSRPAVPLDNSRPPGAAEAQQFPEGLPAEIRKGLNPRVLFITKNGDARSAEALARLSRPGGDFDTLRSAGWKIGEGPENHLQLLERSAVVAVAEKLEPREYPILLCIEGGQIVRSFRSGCTTPLDAWTIAWIAKGINERPEAAVPEAARVESTGHYPLRGNHWSIDDDFSPSRDKVLSHLRTGVHAPQVPAQYAIESWSYEELLSLHDYLHEVVMGGVHGGGASPNSARSDGFGGYTTSRNRASNPVKSAGSKISGS